MRPDSQCARVLKVLADGKPHTVTEIHRRAGSCRLNSRVAELRAQGYAIACTTGPGRGAARYRYQLTDLPSPVPAFMVDAIGQALRFDAVPPVDGETFAPRRPEERFRLYRLTDDDELDLVATCPTPAAVGVALCTLGGEGEWARAAVGVLDTNGDPDSPGTWLISPYEARTR